jgi:O-antigen/teichoic acid export membrane protein
MGFTLIGFVIGALNTMYFYVHFLGKDFYGLTSYLLSTANLLMPIFSFGLNHTLMKYYHQYKNKEDQKRFINFILILPLFIVIPLFVLLYFQYDSVAQLLSAKNDIIYEYLWVLPLTALAMGYFEIFYAMTRIHMKSIAGNVLKEVVLRIIISIFLIAVGYNYLSSENFIYTLIFIYFSVTILMAVIAFKYEKPNFSLGFKIEKKEIITYSLFIIFSSSVAIYLLDLDKFMIGQYLKIENAAFYSVAVFMALTISVPLRAMHQITHPLTSKLMANENWKDLQDLCLKSSLTLQVISGLIFVGIITNLNQIYAFLPSDYAKGFWVVIFIAVAKYYDNILGNNNSIVFYSKYYRVVLALGLFLIISAVGLNLLLIPKFGIYGVALATLIAVSLYNTTKLMFVVIKLKISPFQLANLHSLYILATSFFLFYFWDFNFNPLMNIFLKSILIVVFYVGCHYFFEISKDVNQMIDKTKKYFLK